MRHNRAHLHAPGHLGERAADAVARIVGSWRFVLMQNGMIILWMALNLTGFLLHLDPWPFLFLNIVMSWQAANTGPILQMSSNRQAAKDRKRDDMESQEVELLVEINKRQLGILEGVHRIVTIWQILGIAILAGSLGLGVLYEVRRARQRRLLDRWAREWNKERPGK